MELWNCFTPELSFLRLRFGRNSGVFFRFFGVNGGFVAEKSWLACATGFRVEAILDGAGIGSEASR